MKFFPVVFVVWLIVACGTEPESNVSKNAEENSSVHEIEKDTIITGVLQESKAGWVLLTENAEVIYLENFEADSLFDQKVRVYGTVYEQTTTEEDLGYDNGEYAQGILGTSYHCKVDSLQIIR